MNKKNKKLGLVLILLAAVLLFVGCEPTATPSVTDGGETDSTALPEPTDAVVDTTDEPTEAAPIEKTLRVATFNIKHGADASLNMRTIAGVIEAINPDIVGIQEVDKGTGRSNSMDQPMILAAVTGMKYYAFCRAIDYDGGEYGTLILSKYPIKSSQTIALESGTHEARALGHVQIDFDGISVDFFNTHLSYEETSVRAAQFEQIAAIVKSCDNYIVTGDFNTADFDEFAPLGGTLINRADQRFATFPSSSSGGEIDNIVFSSSFTELDAGTQTPSHSDHIPLWAELKIVG